MPVNNKGFPCYMKMKRVNDERAIKRFTQKILTKKTEWMEEKSIKDEKNK